MLDRLEEAFAQRQESEDRLRRFLADASHELRTPLASIRGYAELFRMGAARSPEEVEKAMRRIEGEAARMGVLVEDLLALARMDEVRDTVRDARGRRGAGRGRGRGRAGDGARPADRARGAARRRGLRRPGRAAAGARGTCCATRSCTRRRARRSRSRWGARTATVRLDVRDHGPGLPDGGGDALFERFWRAEGGRRRGKAGAGLGLAIVAAIVERHQGRVEAADAEGGGARFTVRLPAVAPIWRARPPTRIDGA